MGTSKAAGARLHDALRNTPLRSPGGHHGRPPRLLAGWQAWLGRRLGQGPR